ANNSATSAKNASISANVYTSKALAQAAIDAGTIPLNALFAVSISGSENYQEQYTNTAGVATPTGKVLKDGVYIEALSYEIDNVKYILPGYHQPSSLVALFEDESGNVPLYLDDGAVAFPAIETGTAQNVINTSESFPQRDMDSQLIALYEDENGNVPLSLVDGKFSAAGIETATADLSIDSSNSFPPYRMSPSKVALHVDEAGNVPLCLVDGKLEAIPSDQLAYDIGDIIGTGNSVAVRNTSGSSLYLMRIKKAKLKTGTSGRLVGMAVGDSWSEFYNISQAMANRMFADFGPRAGAGWFQLIIDPSSVWENMIVTRTGWTEYDASYSNMQPPYGCGVDGIAYYTLSNTATVSVTNVKDNKGTVFYYDGTGTFVIGVGSTTTTITGTGTGGYKSAPIPGLTTGLDTLTITTVGNTGVVCLHGFMFETDLNSGCMMHKCGNGGTWAAQHTIFITPRVQYFAQKLNPDFIIVNLGTNDYLQNRTIATYITALNGIIDAWRSALPDVGLILISPPVPNASGATPMVDFRDAMRTVARDKSVEWYDLYGDMPKVWSIGNSLGWWKDSYHPNDVGAAQIVNSLFELLIKK
ncbi:TPA: SGNH/GDSL hydrolase family protein, partial [Serratia marcescens]